MKFKDIETNLKKEQESAGVPDVFVRATRAPLNRLLDGETPAREFQKRIVMRLLVLALALFLVAGICLGALWLETPVETAKPECIVTVEVERAGKVESRIILTVHGECDIVFARAEILDGEESSVIFEEYTLDTMLSVAEGDIVRVRAECPGDLRRAEETERRIKIEVDRIVYNQTKQRRL